MKATVRHACGPGPPDPDREHTKARATHIMFLLVFFRGTDIATEVDGWGSSTATEVRLWGVWNASAETGSRQMGSGASPQVQARLPKIFRGWKGGPCGRERRRLTSQIIAA